MNWPKKFIIKGCHGDAYLIRYFLLRTPWFSIYLHHILRSDEDRELHDHPWSFWSIIIWGGYWEYTHTGVKRYHPGSILWRQLPCPHRLEVDQPAWTLVIKGPRKREWGFYTSEGWLPWHSFLKAKGCD